MLGTDASITRSFQKLFHSLAIVAVNQKHGQWTDTVIGSLNFLISCVGQMMSISRMPHPRGMNPGPMNPYASEQFQVFFLCFMGRGTRLGH